MKVLIVDDNAGTRSMIKIILERTGHRVVGEAGDGDSAIKAFTDLRPDVVLLELGNIMLNAVINYLQNALRKSAIPSVPMLLKGGPAAIVKGLGAYIGPAESFRIVSAAFSVERGGRVSWGEVLLVLPAGLAAELEPG